MEELKNILKELLKIRAELNLNNWSDDSLTDCGVRIFNSNNIQYNKQENKEVKNATQNKPEMASEKQCALIKKLGYSGKIEELTKEEAKTLIPKLMSKQATDVEEEDCF